MTTMSSESTLLTGVGHVSSPNLGGLVGTSTNHKQAMNRPKDMLGKCSPLGRYQESVASSTLLSGQALAKLNAPHAVTEAPHPEDP